MNAIRSALMQGLAGLAVLAGAVFTWQQLQVSRQGQVTDRYTRAIEQLGKDSPVLRVGAIYALERIARDSATDRLTISEVLTTFIRLHAALSPGTDERERPLTRRPSSRRCGTWREQGRCVIVPRTSRRRSRSWGAWPA